VITRSRVVDAAPEVLQRHGNELNGNPPDWRIDFGRGAAFSGWSQPDRYTPNALLNRRASLAAAKLAL